MKVITEPTVTLVGHSIFLEHPEYKVPPDGNNFERGLAFATKGCYDSYGEDGRPCLENQRAVIEHMHGSVCEHGVITVFIEGITRALSLELNRHRHLGISQRSTRYVAEEDTALVLEPHMAYLYQFWETWEKDVTVLERHIDAFEECLFLYKEQVKMLEESNPMKLSGFDLRKWARGIARNSLPHNVETRVTYTGNIRAWRHVLEARSSRHAEPEIRRLMTPLMEVLKGVAPVYFEDYETTMYPLEEDVPEGYPRFAEFTTPYRKI